ncbi:MAG TPA: hypothetical protein VEI02_04580 [Planctomycetota bacterium]|nr:hypothetical protein [Planctomycetota bacterium]
MTDVSPPPNPAPAAPPDRSDALAARLSAVGRVMRIPGFLLRVTIAALFAPPLLLGAAWVGALGRGTTRLRRTLQIAAPVSGALALGVVFRNAFGLDLSPWWFAPAALTWSAAFFAARIDGAPPESRSRAVAVRDALRALPTWVASAVVAAFKAVANVPPSLLARAVLASRPPTAVVRGLNVAALAAAAFFVGAFVAADFLGVGDSVSAWWIIFASWLGLFAGRVAQPLRRPAGASTDAPATA